MSTGEAPKARYLDFNNPAMRKKVAENLQLKKSALKEILLPQRGTRFVLEGLVFEVVYVKNNPLGISAIPIGIVEEEKTDVKEKS
jgi:hypothetical protein